LASRIGEAFGTSAEVWLGLQNMYDLYTLSTNKIEVKELKAIQTRKQELALA
jgi:plasmid maintenance system antidote protein VapI